MIKVALKGLAGRKLRASLSAFAIILGVAMVSGTFVLTDTMNGAFATWYVHLPIGVSIVITSPGERRSIWLNGLP